MKPENNLTEGSIMGVLLRFSVPFLIANIIQALYGAVDLMVIGRYCSCLLYTSQDNKLYIEKGQYEFREMTDVHIKYGQYGEVYCQ